MKATLSMNKRLFILTTGLPKARNGYGNGVFIVPAINTSRVMSTEGEGEQLIKNKEVVPVYGSNVNVKKVKGIYRKMIQIDSLKLGYETISRKGSSNTVGVTKETQDGYSGQVLLDLHQRLKDHSFKLKPIRRITIPKKDGGSRLIGIPSPRDKVVLKAASNVLEEIYEGNKIFLDCNHGFRPGKSTHSALYQIKGWTSVK